MWGVRLCVPKPILQIYLCIFLRKKAGRSHPASEQCLTISARAILRFSLPPLTLHLSRNLRSPLVNPHGDPVRDARRGATRAGARIGSHHIVWSRRTPGPLVDDKKIELGDVRLNRSGRRASTPSLRAQTWYTDGRRQRAPRICAVRLRSVRRAVAVSTAGYPLRA